MSPVKKPRPAAKKTASKSPKKSSAKKAAPKKKSSAAKGGKFSPRGKGKAAGPKKAPPKPKKKKSDAPKRRALPVAVEQELPENPEGLALARKVAALIADKKGENIVLLDVRGKTSYADYIVIASAESERQVAAMGENIETQMKNEGHAKVGSEGYETGQWVLIDFGDVVTHLFYRDVRDFYDLDGLWADAKRERIEAA